VVKPWPGLVDVEGMPAEPESEPEVAAVGAGSEPTDGGGEE